MKKNGMKKVFLICDYLNLYPVWLFDEFNVTYPSHTLLISLKNTVNIRTAIFIH